MAKKMELLIEIGSRLNAKFGSVFNNAQKQVSTLDKQLKDLNGKKEKFSRYESLKKEMIGTTKSINDQKTKLRGLKQQFDKTTDPSKQTKLKQEIEKTENSISKMTRELEKQKTAFNGVKSEIQDGGGYRKYREEIKRTEAQLKKLEKQEMRAQKLRDIQGKMQSRGEKLKQSGANNIKTGMVTGAAIAVPVTLALKDEESFAGVKKVANMAESDLGKLKTELRGLTKDIPIAVEGMYEIAEASLQAGIGADKMGNAKIAEVKGFTQLTAKTATAMDIAESQAGEWLATWKQNLRLSNGEVQDLASRMNHLSDMNNAKAEDIASIFSKIMGTGKVAGFTTQEMVALATSIKAAGVDAEQAGTHLDIMMTRIGKGERASKQTREALADLGLNAQKVADDMQKPGNASKVFLDVLQRIQKLPAGKKLGIANHIFGGDAGKTAAKLVANTDILKKNLDEMSGVSWQGSIDREFANRSATDMNKLKLSFNSLKIMGIQFGAALAPSFAQLVVSLGPFVDKMTQFVSENPAAVKNIGMMVAGFAGLNLALGGLKLAFGGLFIGGAKIIGLFIKFGGISGMIAKIGPLVAKIGPALGALTGPVGWVVMAVIGLVAAFVLLYKKSVWFRNGVNQALNMIKPHVKALGDLLKGYLGKAFEKLKQYAIQAKPHLKSAFDAMKPVIKIIGKLIVSGIIIYIKQLIIRIKIIVAVLKFMWPIIKTIGKLIATGIVTHFKIVFMIIKVIWIALKTLWNIIKFIGKAIRNFVVKEIEKAKDRFNTLKEVGSKIWEVIKVAALKVWTVIKTALKVIFFPLIVTIRVVVGYFKWLGSVFKYVWNGAKAIFKAVWGLIVAIVRKAVEKIKAKMAPVVEFIKAKWESLKARISAVWESIKSRAQMIFRAIQIAVINFIKSAIVKFLDIKAKVTEVVENVKAKFMAGFNYIKSIVLGPINAIKTKIGEIISKVSEILSNVKTKFSEAWETAKGYVGTAVDAIKTKVGEIISKIGEIVTKVKEAFNPANWTVVAVITEKINKVKDKVDGNWTGNSNFGGGLTWLAEKGRELVKYPSGEMAMATSKSVNYLPRGTRIYNNSDTEKMLNQKTLTSEGNEQYKKLNSAGGLPKYTDQKFKSGSKASGGDSINLVINNHYGNQTEEQIKNTNIDLVKKIKDVIGNENDRKRRVSLA